MGYSVGSNKIFFFKSQMSHPVQPHSVKGKPFEKCPECGEVLKFSYISNPHTFNTLDGKKKTVQAFYHCPNKHRFVTPNPYVFPYKRFGIDVYVEVLYQRFHETHTMAEISAHLRETYGLEISEPTISNIINCYLLLQRGEIAPEQIDKMRATKRCILSIDALNPLEGTSPFYIVREVLTATPLRAEFIRVAETPALSVFLSPIKAQFEQLEVPIQGIISDKEKAMVQAIEDTFPGTPHQLCHTHFLANVTEPAMKSDKHLATQLKKELRKNNQLKAIK